MARRQRIFIALELTEHVRKRLTQLQETLTRAGTTLKWVEPDNFHLTLLFLGEIDERELVDVCRAVQREAEQFSPFVMGIGELGCFPTPRRPRVVWVGVDEGAEQVIAVHDAIEEALLDLGCYRRENRRYTPRVTLGRVKGKESTADLSQLVSKKAEWHAGEVSVGEVLVFSSELTSQGPVYTVVSRAKLGSS